MRTASVPPPAASRVSNPVGHSIRFGYRLLFQQILELFRHQGLAQFLFIAAITVGFFHGWLKIRYRAGWITFAYDIPLMAAVVVGLMSVPKKEAMFPKCRMSTALKVFFGLLVLYTFLPFPVPFLIKLASFRGWALTPVMFLLGYHLARSVRQLELYIFVLLFLGTITAVYGIFFQTMDEVLEMMKNDPELNMRFVNQFYAVDGKAHFRVFSTFVSASSFGGCMAFCVMFAVSRMTVAGCPLWERVILLGVTGLLSYATVLTGSRTSMIILGCGLAFTAWYRRGFIRFLLLPAVVAGALVMGAEATRGGSMVRFESLLDFDTVWGRFWIVLYPSVVWLADAPFGGGIGRSGHGVPMIFNRLAGDYDWRPVDGDMGRIIVDMGILGFGSMLAFMVAGVRDGMEWTRRLRDSPLGVVAVPGACTFMFLVITWPTGSPFLAIPAGTLFWFFFGASRRLVDEYERLRKIEGDDVDRNELFVSFIQVPRQASLFAKGGEVPAPATTAGSVRGLRPGASALRRGSLRPPAPVRPEAAGSGGVKPPEKRFLFRRPGR